MKYTENVEIIRSEFNEKFTKQDIVVIEEPITIFINNEEFITLLCSPPKTHELVIGFLYSEGAIKKRRDIDSIIIDKKKGIVFIEMNKTKNIVAKYSGKRVLTTGCGNGSFVYDFNDLRRKKDIVNRNVSEFNIDKINISFIASQINKISPIFRDTGGVHSCSLWESEKMLFSYEDVGRHNALDKIIGKILIDEISIKEKILLTSGRISSEMLIKCAKIGIPIIISRSAPTSLAIKLSKELGVILIGFARGEKYNIY